MGTISRKTTRKEKREYDWARKELEKEERQAAREDNKYLRCLGRFSGRDYFRLPDGRLGYTWAKPFAGWGIGVDTDDPQTREVMSRELRKWARYKIVDGQLELTEKGRKEMEAEKRRLPEWQRARDRVPTQTGHYRCITEVGFLKKKVVEQEVKFASALLAGEWLTPKGTRVVYWLEQ